MSLDVPIRGRRSTRAHSASRSDKRPWVLLMPTIPSSDSTTRVKIWRQLQKVGAVALKNSVYVLPNRDECVEAFEWVSRELKELGGQASLCEGQFFDGVTDEEIERRFVEARNTDYAELATEARGVSKLLGAKRVSSDRLAALSEQAMKLRRRFNEIVAVDFCHAPGRMPTQGLLTSVESSLAELRGDTKQEPLTRVARPSAATWVTRTGVHIDRIACSWLIRRFIDPKATLKFVPPKGYEPQPGELRFDMYEGEFTHVGERCSFEVLVIRMGLTDDAALAAIAEIVHDIDLKEEKYARPETTGVQSLVHGICSSIRDDEARIAAATPVLDGLHAFFRAPKPSKMRQS
ncbi:MAG TPA: chromate resistance protein ChrB domain-containing protein [Polyangiaceae bacterium]|nr:chromate resistance protein ChrB domain-containing protein [Polyangiaceae bacterium]